MSVLSTHQDSCLISRASSILALCLFFLISCSGETAAEFQAEGRKLMKQGNPGGAVVFFKNALEKTPMDHGIRLDLGRAYFAAGKVEQAEDEFLKCFRQQPDAPEVNLEMARLRTLTNKPEQALEHLATVEKQQAPMPETRELAALNYSMLGRLDDAEKSLNEALTLDPAYRSASAALIRLYLAQRKPKEALELSEKLLAAEPEYNEALRLRADIAMRTQDLPKAEACFRKLLKINPNDLEADYMLGTLLLRQDKLAEAKRVRDNMRERFQSSPQESMLSGMIAFQEEDYALASTLFQNCVDARPSTEGYYRLAMSLNHTSNKESALSNLRLILDKAPKYAPALQLSAQILMDQGRLNEAQAEAERLTSAYPNSAAGFYLLGTILSAKGEAKASLNALDKALEINPAMSEATLRRSSILMAEGRFTEAAQGLSKAIEADSGNIQARTALFNYHLGRRDLTAAERIVDEGLKENADNPVLLTLKAILHLNRKNDALALETITKARNADPDLLPALSLVLRIHMLAGGNQEALEECDKYLGRHPEATDLLITSASLLDGLGRPDEAQARLEKALALGEGRALVYLARRDLAAKQPEKAEQRILEELKKNPSSGLRSMLAEFYKGQKQPDKALAIYDALEQQEPGEAAMGKYRLLLSMGKHDDALAMAEKMKQLDPKSPVGAICAADVWERRNDTDKALAELDTAYRNLDMPPLLVAMGNLCMRAKQLAKADSYFAAALKRNPNDRQALAGQAYIMMRNKKYSSAIANYEKVLELAPADVGAMNNLAMALAEEGKHTARAVEEATKAFVFNSDNPQILDTLAFCLLADKREAEAVNVLKNGLVAHPDSAILHYRYGVALLRTGQKEKGIAALEKALTLGSFDEEQTAKDLIQKNK